ncbi:TetR/AcrR family transcriptional regulator [Dyadobacter helix]|uniref:TetR/AcrR family transcriptional regulator n=1 Tax=Dyadobacter helix TaxID=2822344 RepID=UPI001E62ADF7|nr:TetR/AcrR family transcriptional regulator [Dyadobacter sp. CECT 9275]
MRERIIKSALSLFWRYGIKSVTMDDIAHDLGISKRTIYQHFPDKEAILVLVIEQELTSQKCEMEKLGEAAPNPIDEMLRASEQIRICMVNINPVFLYDLKKYYPKAWNLFAVYKNDFILRGIRENLLRGKHTGLYRDDIDVNILSILRIEQIELAFDPTIFPPDKFNMTDLQLEFVQHFLRGVLSEKGHQYYNTIQNKSVIESNIP